MTKGSISKVGSRIIHDAKISEGNSGGPLVSLTSGRVVGINTAKSQGSTEYYIALPSKAPWYMLMMVTTHNYDLIELEVQAAGGDADSMANLAAILSICVDIDKRNWHRSLLLYTKAAELGNTNALYNLALMYLKPDSKHQNVGLAIQLLKESGTEKSYTKLCEIYLNGVKGGGEYEINVQDAFNFVKSYSETGKYEAYLALAHCYRLGIGTKQDSNEAIKILRRALEIEGSDSSKIDLIKLHLSKALLSSSKKKDWNEAITILKDLAKSSSSSIKGAACASLGSVYFSGKKVKMDLAQSTYYYKIGAEAKDLICMANLGIAYLQGKRGVERNPQLGIELIQESVRLGGSEAALGYIGSYLIELKQYRQGFELLQRAAAAGNNLAACDLAVCYYYGEGGIRVDRKKAESIIRRVAVDSSDSVAQDLAKKLMKHWGISRGHGTSRGKRHHR